MPIMPGLMTYSYHLSFPAGKISSQGIAERAEQLGLKSLEWCHFPCHEPGKVDWQQVKLLDRLGREKGIVNAIAGFAPLLTPKDRRDSLIDSFQTQLEVSKFIGASRMRFHGMTEIALGIGPKPSLETCLDNLKRIIELAERAGIVIALENHNDFRIENFRYFFKHIQSPFLKLNLDTGNQLPLGEDVLALAREFQSEIVSCHFKAIRYVWRDYGAVLTSCNVEDSIIDLTEILNLLLASEREIKVHIEIVAMRSEEEDPFIANHSKFLREYLNR
ncbi:sugar phosphate isomerase/epimerase [candidate division KSB1 bacterium]|nr:sugar phosphate isomerase/epimerase [candidate division KSB1 bacterium]